MKLFDVTVSLGGRHTIHSQAYGKTQQHASNNMIAALKNNYPNMELTVIKIKEVKQDVSTQANDCQAAAAR